jgi:protein-tyrosine phosphatase
VALVLRILGVSEEDILEEFLLSNVGFDPLARKFAVLMRVMSLWQLDTSDVEPILHVHEEYLKAGFDAVITTYGSWDAYYADGLGLDDATLQNLRTRFLREAFIIPEITKISNRRSAQTDWS